MIGVVLIVTWLAAGLGISVAPRQAIANVAIGYSDPGTPSQEKHLAQWRVSVFQPGWNSDACAQKQSWTDYWAWVRTFYLDDTYGWFGIADSLLEESGDDQTRNELRPRLEALGKRVAAEWSKDNSCRKIDNSTVFRWRAALKAAKNGAEIKKAVSDIAREVDLRLKPSS